LYSLKSIDEISSNDSYVSLLSSLENITFNSFIDGTSPNLELCLKIASVIALDSNFVKISLTR